MKLSDDNKMQKTNVHRKSHRHSLNTSVCQAKYRNLPTVCQGLPHQPCAMALSLPSSRRAQVQRGYKCPALAFPGPTTHGLPTPSRCLGMYSYSDPIQVQSTQQLFLRSLPSRCVLLSKFSVAFARGMQAGHLPAPMRDHEATLSVSASVTLPAGGCWNATPSSANIRLPG